MENNGDGVNATRKKMSRHIQCVLKQINRINVGSIRKSSRKSLKLILNSEKFVFNVVEGAGIYHSYFKNKCIQRKIKTLKLAGVRDVRK